MKAFSKFPNFYQKFRRKASDYFQKLSRRSLFQSILNPQSQRGQAMIMAMIFLMMATMLITVGMKLISSSNSVGRQQEEVVSEADEVARAGVESTLAWFTRQTNQPVAYYLNNSVTAVNPIYTPGWVDEPFNPTPIAGVSDVAGAQVTVSTGDTINSSLGLVNQYQIGPNLWGRYVVIRQANPTTIAPTATPNPLAVHDVSGNRIPNNTVANGSGLVWDIVSTGYVYRNTNPNVAYNVPPNQVLATAQVRSELRKIGYTAPAAAAAISPSMSNILFGSSGDGRLSAGPTTGGTYIGYSCAAQAIVAGQPATANSSELSGNKDATAVGASALKIATVFGMTESDIQGVADITGDSLTAYQAVSLEPINNITNQLIYFHGNLDYNPCNASTTPYQTLQASGILFVDGNFSLEDTGGCGNGSYFSGVIYAMGNVYVGGNNFIYGTVIAAGLNSGTNGSVSVTGSSASGDGGIWYDQTAIDDVNLLTAVYREDKSTTHSIFVPSFH